MNSDSLFRVSVGGNHAVSLPKTSPSSTSHHGELLFVSIASRSNPKHHLCVGVTASSATAVEIRLEDIRCAELRFISIWAKLEIGRKNGVLMSFVDIRLKQY
jgi:hypothetical protein